MLEGVAANLAGPSTARGTLLGPPTPASRTRSLQIRGRGRFCCFLCSSFEVLRWAAGQTHRGGDLPEVSGGLDDSSASPEPAAPAGLGVSPSER